MLLRNKIPPFELQFELAIECPGIEKGLNGIDDSEADNIIRNFDI